MMKTRTRRTEKLDIRLTPAAKHTLYAAATAAQRSVSDFVFESALVRAWTPTGGATSWRRLMVRRANCHGCNAC